MKTLEELKQGRSRFGGAQPGAPEEEVKPSRDQWQECNMLYRAALWRIRGIAEHIDRVNALMVEPLTMELSETFLKRDRDLTQAIETEWLSAAPDLAKFSRLITDWEECCLVELRSWMEKLRQAMGWPGV